MGGNSGLMKKGQGSPAGSLIQAHADCIAIFCSCWCSVQAEDLEAGPRSGMELAELTGIAWRWYFLQGAAGGFIDPEHSYLTKCEVPGGITILVHASSFPPVFSDSALSVQGPRMDSP